LATSNLQPPRPLPSFDQQAQAFGTRAGLPRGVGAEVARAVLDAAAGGLVVEIGPGTGEIGCDLAAGASAYVGIEASARMLQLFETHLASRPPAMAGTVLHLGDAGRSWPLADGTASAVFGSRVFHLIDADHVVSETLRVGRRERVVLLAGRIERDPASVRDRMRRRMRELLEARGVHGRSRHKGRVVEAALGRGASATGPRSVARWRVTHRPLDSLAAWRDKPGLDMIEVPEAIKAAVLAELEAWAAAELGALDEPQASEEQYLLEALVFERAGTR
jgi:SAM-dependent methyltransferase